MKSISPALVRDFYKKTGLFYRSDISNHEMLKNVREDLKMKCTKSSVKNFHHHRMVLKMLTGSGLLWKK